jgi:hypothetical protein
MLNSLKHSLVVLLVAVAAYHLTPPSLFGPVARVEITEEDKMTMASKIAGYVIKKAPGGPDVTFGELWKDQSCVVVFFRRFG